VGELRARVAWHDGDPALALRILEDVDFRPLSVGMTNIVPFLAHAQARYLHGELLAALGRSADAIAWFESLGRLSVPESPFRAPAHLRLAELHERLGNRAESVRHYTRFIELWQDGDPEVRAVVHAAAARLAAISRLDTLPLASTTPPRASSRALPTSSTARCSTVRGHAGRRSRSPPCVRPV
jgi:tetratricopeptide (TPR) repeat protein